MHQHKANPLALAIYVFLFYTRRIFSLACLLDKILIADIVCVAENSFTIYFRLN